MKVIAVYDIKADCYETPFFKANVQIAMREFALVCRDSQMLMNQFPDDYELHELGDFDKEIGVFQLHLRTTTGDEGQTVILPKPKILCTARQCLVLEEKNDDVQ